LQRDLSRRGHGLLQLLRRSDRLALTHGVLPQAAGEPLTDADDEGLLGTARGGVVDLVERPSVAGDRERVTAKGEMPGIDIGVLSGCAFALTCPPSEDVFDSTYEPRSGWS
jgi:hypothetical protein